MSSSNPESVFDLAALAVLAREPAARASVEADVMALFDRCGPSLCRYVVSCGLAADQAEDVVQDVFLALFRHLCLGRPRTNLRAWLFQVVPTTSRRRSGGSAAAASGSDAGTR